MRFKEEVLAKVFTYITVIVLLAAVVFEAWSQQTERDRRKEAESEAAATQDSLQKVIDQNASLQEEKENLQALWDEWKLYAAFVDRREVMSLETDLFTRPDLIPVQAAQGYSDMLLARWEEEEAAAADSDSGEGSGNNESTQRTSDGRSGSDGVGNTDGADEEENEADEREAILSQEFTFDNPDGENIFLPVSAGTADSQTCLVYTVAFGKEDGGQIELLYEIDFEAAKAFAREEGGKMEWNCIAYDVGEGWTGIVIDKAEE